MRVSVTQSDIDLLTRHYKFCAGFNIPEDVSLADVLGVLEQFTSAHEDFLVGIAPGTEIDDPLADAAEEARGILSKLKREEK